MKEKEQHIIFYNHFHRGDLFTHKEFVRQIKEQYIWPHYEYWHFNHPKCNADLDIPLTKIPFDIAHNKTHFIEDTDSFIKLGINTWVACYGDIFTKNGGVNLLTMYESWGKIYELINEVMGFELSLKPEVTDYIPTINFNYFDNSKVDEFLKVEFDKRILFCNGTPMSNQSGVAGDMAEYISSLSFKYPNICFITTQPIRNTLRLRNVRNTDEIIQDKSVYHVKTPWNDRPINNCDLNEIAYLSTKCDAVVGKNSGPFVFCENRTNLLNPNMRFLNFANSTQESITNGTKIACDYRIQTKHDDANVYVAIKELCEDICRN